MFSRITQTNRSTIIFALLAVMGVCGIILSVMFNRHNEVNDAARYAYWNADVARRKFADNPNDPRAIRGMVIQAGLRGDQNAEIAYLDKLYKIDPNDRAMTFRFGYRLIQTRDDTKVQRAITLLRVLARKQDGLGKKSSKIVDAYDRNVHRQSSTPMKGEPFGKK